MSKILSDDMKFDRIFWISTTAMRLNRSHPFIPRNNIWRVQFAAIFILSVVCFILLLYSTRFDILDGRFTDATKNVVMAIVAFTITYKYGILLYYQESITSLIRIMDEDYEAAKDFTEEEQSIIMHFAVRGHKVGQFWVVSGVTTGLIFPIKAFLLMGKSYIAGDFKPVAMFELTYPWFLEEYKNVHIFFIVLFLLALFFDVYSTSMYIGFDPLVPIFMLHLCGQIHILKIRLSHVFSDPSNSEEMVREKLRTIILKLQDIYSFIEVIKTNFTMLYEFNMKTTTFLLPLSAFQVTESLRHGEINLEFFGFFTAVILHFLMPCLYSDLLMETGDDFRLALYSCGWEKHSDLRARRTVLFMMTRSTKPLVISTVFYAICLDTFAKMCRDAYSIFNLMNAAWA